MITKQEKLQLCNALDKIVGSFLFDKCELYFEGIEKLKNLGLDYPAYQRGELFKNLKKSENLI